jgi:hypothetical protein
MLEEFFEKYHRTECQSIGVLYGGAKTQTTGLTKILSGSMGRVIVSRKNSRGIEYCVAKFKIDGRILWVRCARQRLLFDEPTL